MRFDSRSTGIFVWMTDKFMSGWGQAGGKINKLIIRCDTLEQAECIFKNAQMRDEMKNINYGRKLPYFSESKYKLSFKTWDQLGYVWKTGCKWQNEDDYYSDPGRMRYTMEGLRGNRRGLRKNQMRSSFDKPVFGPGRAEYKRIDTTTGAGMRLEQKMRRAGWYQAQVTPFSTVLYRKKRR